MIAGVLIAIGGLALAFAESVDVGDAELAVAGAAALAVSRLGAAVGNISIKLRAARARRRRAERLGDARRRR